MRTPEQMVMAHQLGTVHEQSIRHCTYGVKLVPLTVTVDGGEKRRKLQDMVAAERSDG